MPELPEVETIARGLAPLVTGKRIVAIERLDWERMIQFPDVTTFRAELTQHTIGDVGRRAKWLLVRLDGGFVWAIHLRMSGRVGVSAPDVVHDQHTHLICQLDDGQLFWFRDPRKFGRVQLLDAHHYARLDASLGIEPLTDAFTADALATIITTRRAHIKPLLLNQHLIAGLGNIYVDESLWLAKIHPKQLAHTLVYDDIVRLQQAIRTTLEQSLHYGGSTLRDYRSSTGKPGDNQRYVAVYGRTNAPCQRCGTAIERIVVVQRGTHVCPYCQVVS